jgi:hypothetical protein
MEQDGGEELAADDNKGLARKGHVRRWDRARKRYVNVAPGVDPNDRTQVGRRLKLDDGRVVKAVPTGKYDEWQKKSHKRIGTSARTSRSWSRRAQSMRRRARTASLCRAAAWWSAASAARRRKA